ncbi:MAG: DUF4838 domain-containing protein [Planctomycetota bacterium]
MSHKFKIRGFNLVESILRHSEEQLRRFIRRMEKLKFNTLIVHYDYGWNRFKNIIMEEARKANIEVCLMVFGPRTIYRFVDYKPEWLAKNEDGSLITDKLECNTKPCGSNLEALEAYGYGIKQFLKALPKEIKRIQLRYADGSCYCQCPLCRNLPEYKHWLPFVEVAAKVFAEKRPDISTEYDAYVKRWDLPEGNGLPVNIDRIMFDTFGRQISVPIGKKSNHTDMVKYLVSKKGLDAESFNEYLANRISDWTKSYPRKVYIHENLMVQGQASINGDHTGVLLEDLRLYRDIGVQGVCYEAYELGYEHFEQTVKILSEAMLDIDSLADHRPTRLEKAITSGQWDVGSIFCKDKTFPLEEYISDTIVRSHIQNYRDLLNEPNPRNLKKFVEHLYKYKEHFDFLVAAFWACKWCMAKGSIKLARASEAVRNMLEFNKLWDFMEDVSIEEDPRKVVEKLLIDAVKHAE